MRNPTVLSLFSPLALTVARAKKLKTKFNTTQHDETVSGARKYPTENCTGNRISDSMIHSDPWQPRFELAFPTAALRNTHYQKILKPRESTEKISAKCGHIEDSQMEPSHKSRQRSGAFGLISAPLIALCRSAEVEEPDPLRCNQSTTESVLFAKPKILLLVEVTKGAPNSIEKYVKLRILLLSSDH